MYAQQDFPSVDDVCPNGQNQRSTTIGYHRRRQMLLCFFFLFASALALFLASLYAKSFQSFYSFSEAKRFFYFLSTISDYKS